MAIVTGLVMVTSFTSLTSFGIAAPAIARTMHLSASVVTTYGIDSFSIGLFWHFLLVTEDYLIRAFVLVFLWLRHY